MIKNCVNEQKNDSFINTYNYSASLRRRDITCSAYKASEREQRVASCRSTYLLTRDILGRGDLQVCIRVSRALCIAMFPVFSKQKKFSRYHSSLVIRPILNGFNEQKKTEV